MIPEKVKPAGKLRQPVWTQVLLPLASFLLPLGLYSSTACRDIFWMDSTEFMLVGRHLALSHPPGYPLLTLILRLTSLVPVLNLPLRMNLVSSLAAASSCLAFFFVVRRLTNDPLAALLSALVWSVSFELWQQATVLEVYAFQILIVTLVLLMLVKWAAGDGSRWLLGAAFFFGIGLANHLFIITLLPGLTLLLLAGPWRNLDRRTVLVASLLLLLGPCLYIYVPLRSERAALSYWGGTETLPGLVEYITGRVYRYRFLAGGANYLRTQLGELPGILGRQFTLFWLLAVPGLILLWRKHRHLLAGLILTALLSASLSLVYNIPDKEGYLLPAWLISAVFIGSGIAFLRNTRASRAATIAVCAGIVTVAALSYPRQDRSRLHTLADMSRTLIAELPERAILFTNDYSIFQGVSWLLDSGTHDHSITVVSEHHLAFPWYLDRLAKSLAVPERVFELCRRLWNRAGRTNDAAFGEEAKSVTENIRYEITRSILPSRPVFWIPRDFGDWPREWRDYFLLLNGLSYRVSALPDSSVPEPLLAFPDPDMYNTTRFRDAESQDFCRRLAAAVNRRGMLRFERNFIAGALADFDLSIAYYPEYSAPIENKGLIYYFTGQPDSAAKYLRLFLRMDPQSPETSKVKTVLRSIGQLPDF